MSHFSFSKNSETLLQVVGKLYYSTVRHSLGLSLISSLVLCQPTCVSLPLLKCSTVVHRRSTTSKHAPYVERVMHFTINYHAFNPHPPSRKQQPSLQKKHTNTQKDPKNIKTTTKCKSNQTLRVNKCLKIAMILHHKCSFHYQDQAFHKNYMIRARPSSTQQNHTPKSNKQKPQE